MATPDDTIPGAYTGPEELTIKLKKPIRLHETDENPVTEINLTEPTAGQLSKFLKAQAAKGADDVEAGCVLISLNSGISKAHALLLTSRDFEEALDFLTGFTKAAQKVGLT